MYQDKVQAPCKSITVIPSSTKDPARLLKATHHVCSLLEGGGSFPSGPARPLRVLLVYNAGPARQAYCGGSSKVARHGLSLLALCSHGGPSAMNQGDQLIPIPPSAAGILPPSPLHSTEKLVRGR